MNKGLPNLQQGITLVEIIITMMVVGFVVLIIANVPQSIRLIGSSDKQSLAKDIVNKEVETLRTQGYGLLSDGTTQISDPRLTNLPAASSSVIVSDCPVAICANGEQTKKAEVKVSWNDQGKIENVDVVTLISQGGLQ